MLAGPFDISILGAGLAGQAAAVVLGGSGHRVTLYGRKETGLTIGEHLPPEGVLALARIGLADLLNDPAHRACAAVASLWGAGPETRRSVLSMPGGRAFNLDRTHLHHALNDAAHAMGVRFVTTRRAPVIEGTPGRWTLHTTGGDGGHAHWLIDATGRAAVWSRALGAQTVRDDDLIGLAGVLSLHCTDSALLTRALPDGWAYLAPLSQNRAVGVTLTDADLLPSGASDRRSHWLGRLQDADMFPSMKRASAPSPIVVPAWSQRSVQTCGPGWIAVGDAAQAYDPLSSGGMTKALTDAAELSEFLTDPTPEACEALEARRQARYDAYAANLRRAYMGEHRFAGRFWSRRQTSSAA